MSYDCNGRMISSEMSVECFIGTREEHLLSRGIFHLEADKSSCAEAKISGGTLPSHGAERPKEAEGIFFSLEINSQ